MSLAKGIVSQMEHMGRSYAASDTAHYNLVRPYDVVYTRSPLAAFPLGIVKQYKGRRNAIVSPLYGVFTPKNRYLGQLIEAFFDSPTRSMQFLDPIAQKGAKNTIQLSNDRFLSGALSLPGDEVEQKKIAEFLGSLDNLITAEDQKLEALRQHKQGMMQQLFPQAGKTVPKLRFPEFRKASHWRPRLAASLFSRRVEKGEAGLPIYSVTIGSGMVERSTFDRNFYDIEDAAGNKRVRKDDIAYNTMRMWQGACGVAPVDCMVSPAYVVISPSADAHSLFFEYLFKTAPLLELLTAHSRGLTKDRLRLYYEDFAAISLVVPDRTEQIRIAECLSTHDRLISAQEARLLALYKYKQGLLQQFFPGVQKEPL